MDQMMKDLDVRQRVGFGFLEAMEKHRSTFVRGNKNIEVDTIVCVAMGWWRGYRIIKQENYKQQKSGNSQFLRDGQRNRIH